MICAMGEASGSCALASIKKRMLANPDGQRILQYVSNHKFFFQVSSYHFIFFFSILSFQYQIMRFTIDCGDMKY